jgi:co-chaperonin GroES (HSP10)
LARRTTMKVRTTVRVGGEEHLILREDEVLGVMP